MKIGPIDVDAETRMNPDTSAGLYCSNETRYKARAVQEAKRKKKELDEQKRKANDLRNAQQAQKKLDAFTKVLQSVQSMPQERTLSETLSKFSTEHLKLTYQRSFTSTQR